MSDPVDHPDHYGGVNNPHECIKVLEDWLTPQQLSGFLIGNVIKYLCRSGSKGDPLQDLRKALWYLDREIERLCDERTHPTP